MLKKIDPNTFKQIIPLGLYNNPDFVLITAKSINAKADFLIYFENDKPLIAFIIYFNKKKIIVPDYYPVYNSFWIKESLKEKKINQILIESLKTLKEKFENITFNLPVNFYDVRPFIWENFNIKIKYTYLKNLNDLNFKSDVKNNYSKAVENLNLIFKEDVLSDEIWNYYQIQLSSLGFTTNKLKRLKYWILNLHESGLVKIFVVKNQDKLYCGSSIVILDSLKSSAGLLLNHTLNDSYQSQKTAFLYVKTHKWLENEGYKELDYLGANTKNIAEFKSNFNPVLQTYYAVNYNFKKAIWYNLKNKLKSLIINLLKKDNSTPHP
jgi:hypothetical protein